MNPTERLQRMTYLANSLRRWARRSNLTRWQWLSDLCLWRAERFASELRNLVTSAR